MLRTSVPMLMRGVGSVDFIFLSCSDDQTLLGTSGLVSWMSLGEAIVKACLSALPTLILAVLDKKDKMEGFRSSYSDS